ncbi:MAG: threonine--tRNA ligase, partial [bacterium]|nr:threonine--tRNA ligase [bacterium]
EGGGAFYGPKIDIKIKDALGRDWQCSTIQFDFSIPERFDVNYIGEDGRAHRPYMIHRALLGSMERFIGCLIEHYKGAFPPWLTPEQFRIMTITDDHRDYAESIRKKLKAADFRVTADLRNEKIGFKIREAQLMKVPYMIITGQNEMEAGTVTVRLKDGTNFRDIKLDQFLADRAAELNQPSMEELPIA